LRLYSDVGSWTGRGSSRAEGGARLPTKMHRLGPAAMVAVVMTLTLAGCTSSQASSPRSSSLPMRSPATLVTATTTVSRADLPRFIALAHNGLREPFEATYQFVPPLGKWGGHVHNFRVWSEPAVGSDPEGNFVFESPFGRGTFRFLQTGNGDYECLQAAPRRAWKCVGPFGPQSIGQIMLVEGYRMPVVVAEDLSTGLVGPLVLSDRTVLGRRLWCLNVLNITFEGFLCLTKTGQLAFDDKLFIGPRELELVSLMPTESKSAFLLPAKPKPWRGELLPNLCGKVQCPSLGML
jgi:hypothetical protein